MKEFLKTEWRKVKNILMWWFIIFGVFLAIFIRFTHPDITETRLFLDFWGYWILDASFFFAAAILLKY